MFVSGDLADWRRNGRTEADRCMAVNELNKQRLSQDGQNDASDRSISLLNDG
jgi:hypothetical protein